jgi:hypothetical protein
MPHAPVGAKKGIIMIMIIIIGSMNRPCLAFLLGSVEIKMTQIYDTLNDIKINFKFISLTFHRLIFMYGIL